MTVPLQAAVPALILASASSARRAVLAAAGLQFEAVAASVDEAMIRESAHSEGLTAKETALLLADAKAARIASRRPEALILGADQILTCQMDGVERWFEKPVDPRAARAQLRLLRGRVHSLVTALVCWRDGSRVWQHVAVPCLEMRDVSDAFIDAYLAHEGDAVLASVGAYRLEGLGVQLFRSVEGEQAAILGLPLLPLLGFLRDHGVLLR
jgi:septum formation protein